MVIFHSDLEINHFEGIHPVRNQAKPYNSNGNP